MSLILARILLPIRAHRPQVSGPSGTAGAGGASRAECAPFREGPMHRVLILGAGKIGALLSGLLAESGAYRVQLADVDGAAAEGVVRAHGGAHLTPFTLDARNGPA